MSSPPCPNCAGTQARLMQRIPSGLLRALWKHGFGVDAKQLRGESPGLYDCGCGLRFYAPGVAGDAEFYRTLYRHPVWQRWLHSPATAHADFVAAARHARPGDAVLDVGGHAGTFASLLPPGASAIVIDPHADEYGLAGVLRQTAAEHAAQHGARYDMVCGFQVIEHVERPVDLARDMLACLKPGGLLVLAAPAWPSLFSRIPNMVVNAPPHHLSIWSEAAFRHLAAELALDVVEARALPATAELQAVYGWMARLAPTAAPDQPFVHSWPVHLRLGLAHLMTRPLNALFGPGTPGEGTDVILVARKP